MTLVNTHNSCLPTLRGLSTWSLMLQQKMSLKWVSTSALDNGYHIITYSLLNSDGASADTYYRVFDAHSMEFVTEETLIANHPNYVADRILTMRTLRHGKITLWV